MKIEQYERIGIIFNRLHDSKRYESTSTRRIYNEKMRGTNEGFCHCKTWQRWTKPRKLQIQSTIEQTGSDHIALVSTNTVLHLSEDDLSSDQKKRILLVSVSTAEERNTHQRLKSRNLLWKLGQQLIDEDFKSTDAWRGVDGKKPRWSADNNRSKRTP